MYLVDTSVWIDAQQRKPRRKGQLLREWTETGVVFGLAPVILQEILQGTRNEKSFEKTRYRLSLERCYMPGDPVQTFIEAGRLYARCRWQGYMPRSSNDCLIAQLAIEHDLVLLHDDADFEKIAQVEPRLRLA
ncbi:MAG: type II toxin-antitoxin system VapC family toxin [Gammaproteobacteria bacterium]